MSKKKRPYNYPGFTCTNCGHDDYVHTIFVGGCNHGQMQPRDGLDCDCPEMDWNGTPRGGE